MNFFGLNVTRAAPRGGLTPVSPYGSNKGGWGPYIREAFSGAWQRNITWTTDTVLAHHAVYACITRIAQDIGKLRPKLVERGGDSEIWEETTNTAHAPVLRAPNGFQNHIQFKEWWTTSKLVNGNTYVLKERDNRGVVVALYILDSTPGRVQVLVAPDGSVFYNLKIDYLSGLNDDEIAVPASEIIHDRINCLYHPLIGTSPIFACGMAANMGLQIQTNQSGFFSNGSNPSGILSSPVTITPQKSLELSELWNARFGKDKSGGVAVLGDGMTFVPMRMNAVDSQLIQQLQWTAETVCSTFHVPPWKIQIGSQPAYTKPEIANQAYYSDCLQSPIEQWELCMDHGLGIGEGVMIEGRELGVELDLDGLLRMDMASQITSLKEGVSGSIYTVNDARKKLDLEPVDGGDEIWMQQQNFSLPALAKRDAQADPFGTTPPPAPAVPAPQSQKALPAGAPAAPTRAAVVSDDDDPDLWNGWFARDALALVREAHALQSSVVERSIESERLTTFTDSTRAAIDLMTRTVQALAERDTIVNVAPAQVHIAPTTVNITPPDVNVALTIPPEPGQTVTRYSKVIRNDIGALVGVETTEVKS